MNYGSSSSFSSSIGGSGSGNGRDTNSSCSNEQVCTDLGEIIEDINPQVMEDVIRFLTPMLENTLPSSRAQLQQTSSLSAAEVPSAPASSVFPFNLPSSTLVNGVYPLASIQNVQFSTHPLQQQLQPAFSSVLPPVTLSSANASLLNSQLLDLNITSSILNSLSGSANITTAATNTAAANYNTEPPLLPDQPYIIHTPQQVLAVPSHRPFQQQRSTQPTAQSLMPLSILLQSQQSQQQPQQLPLIADSILASAALKVPPPLLPLPQLPPPPPLLQSAQHLPPQPSPSSARYEMRVIQHPIRSRVASVMDAVDHRPIDPAPVIELVASSIPASTLANVYRLYMTATLITASTAHLDYDGAEALQQSGGDSEKVEVLALVGDEREVMFSWTPKLTPASLDDVPSSNGSHLDSVVASSSSSSSSSSLESTQQLQQSRAKHSCTFGIEALSGTTVASMNVLRLQPLSTTTVAAVTTTAVADIPSSSTASNDHLANERLIFAFPSLSVRLEGHYRLRFSLFETISDGYGGCQVEYRGSVVSNPFTVYAAKKFPGMMPASDLSRMLAERGIRVRVRNETAAKQTKQTRLAVSTASTSSVGPMELNSAILAHRSEEPQTVTKKRPRRKTASEHGADSGAEVGQFGSVPTSSAESVIVGGGVRRGRPRKTDLRSITNSHSQQHQQSQSQSQNPSVFGLGIFNLNSNSNSNFLN